MPTCRQALDYYRKAVKDGKGELHTGHPYIAEEEEKKRQSNAGEKPKTKIAWDAADPDSYAEWHKERARWMAAAAKNPTLATDAMIVALKAYAPEGIAVIINTLGSLRAKQAEESGIPRAHIPTGNL